jgi:ABC-2 type transport system permease protein
MNTFFTKIKKQILNTLTIAKYMILMFFRERTAIFFSLFIPVMLMSIFGVINLGNGVKFNVVVVDEANNQYSQQVVDVIKKVSSFNVTTENKDKALVDLKNSKQSYALVIPNGFGSNFTEYAANQAKISQLPVSQQAAAEKASVVTPQEIVIYYDQSQNASTISVGFTIFSQIFDGVTHQLARVPNFFEVKQISISGDNLKYIDFLIPGLVAMSVMQLSIFAVTGQIVSWRERGILKRLLATPIHPGVIIFSQIVSRVIITFMQASILILLGIVAFNLQVVGNLGLVVFLIVIGGLIFLSMGFALSGIASTQNTVAALANLFVFPQMFLSGIFFPRDAFPDWLIKASNYFPLTYFSDALRNVMVKGYTFVQIQGDLIGLAVWAIIMFVLAIRLFRWE